MDSNKKKDSLITKLMKDMFGFRGLSPMLYTKPEPVKVLTVKDFINKK